MHWEQNEGRQWDFRTGQGTVKYDKIDGLGGWEYGDAIQRDEASQRQTLEKSGQLLVSDIYSVMPSRILDIRVMRSGKVKVGEVNLRVVCMEVSKL